MLVTSIFSYANKVSGRLFPQGRQNSGLYGAINASVCMDITWY